MAKTFSMSQRMTPHVYHPPPSAPLECEVFPDALSSVLAALAPHERAFALEEQRELLERVERENSNRCASSELAFSMTEDDRERAHLQQIARREAADAKLAQELWEADQQEQQKQRQQQQLASRNTTPSSSSNFRPSMRGLFRKKAP